MKNKLPWDLIVSQLRREISIEDEIIFNKWLTEGDNKKLFQQLKFVWENVQQRVAVYEPDLEYYWNELSSRIEKIPVVDTKTKLSQNIVFRRIIQVAAAVAVLLVTTFSLSYFLHQENSGNAIEYTTYSTMNSKSRVFLPDSTEVWLHNNTSLTYCYNKKQAQREVDISGEAYFNVRHDAENPFLVQANGVVVKVHGTQFNVCSYPSSDEVLVSLLEGSVSMKAENKDVYLMPGEEGMFNVNSKEISVAKGDIEFARIWTSDKIRFEDKSLREVCKYLSKWYAIEFNIDSTITDNQSYTFTFRGQSLDEVVGIMSSINSFNYHIDEENKTVLIKK